jgi:uncharacterized paraquat-inducible protein A
LKRYARAIKQSSMVWIGIILASSLLLSLFLQAPTVIGMIILWAFSFYLSLVLRKLLAEQHKDLYNTSTTSTTSIDNNSIIKYHCMLCGKYHDNKSCPECGLKMKKASF